MTARRRHNESVAWQRAVLLRTVLCAVVVAACSRSLNSNDADSGGALNHSKPGVHRVAGGAAANQTLPSTQAASSDSSLVDASSYEGMNSDGTPHYLALRVSSSDSAVLRRAYGIEDPHRLYLSDSTDEGLLKYDTKIKRCRTCYVNSYRIGYVSVRRSGESWDEAERRVRSSPIQAFEGGTRATSRSTADLDPNVRPLAETMLRAARTAGFDLHVTATYRSPRREALLMAEGRGRTHTLTSNHSYGRAMDIVVDDGNRSNPRTQRDWINFRRWVTLYTTPSGESFRILGSIDRTWDWPHVEMPSPKMRFDALDQAIRRGRACLAAGATVACNFQPNLPPYLRDTLVR